MKRAGWVELLISLHLEDNDLVDPFTELGDPRVHAGLVGFRATDAPRNDARQHPGTVVFLDHHRTAAVTLYRFAKPPLLD